MKKSIAIILSIILVLAITLPATAVSVNAVKSIKLANSKITLRIGQTSNLKVTFTPVNTSQKLLTYVTGNKKIATVDSSGKITGVGAGATTITVYTLNKKAFTKCDVTVLLRKEDLKASLNFYLSSPTDQAELNISLPKFNKTFPKITVNTTVTTGFDAITVAIAGGEKIDVVAVNFARAIPQGLYYPLNDLIKNDGFDYKKAFGNYGQVTSVNNIIYGMPKGITPGCVWLSKKLLVKAGIPLPDANWTFDDYFAMMKKLTEKDDKGNITLYGGKHWQGDFQGIIEMAVYGGWDIVKKDGTPNINDPALRKSIQTYYNAIIVDKSMPSDADMAAKAWYATDNMLMGQIASVFGSMSSGILMDKYKISWKELSEEDDKNNNFIMMYVPRFDSNSTPKRSQGTTISYAVAKQTKSPDAAYQFLKWYTTEGAVVAQKYRHMMIAWQNADVNQLIQDWTYMADANNKLTKLPARDALFSQVLDKTVIPIFPTYKNNYSYSGLLLEALRSEVSLLLAKEKDVDTMLKDANAACQAIYLKQKE